MSYMNRASGLIVLSGLLSVGSAAAGPTPEEKCEADKNKIAGKYAFCRQKAEMKAIKKEEPADYTKCDSKLLLKWQKAAEKAVNKGTTCMDSVSDPDIQSFVTAHADAVAAALDGGTLPECGDGSLNAVGEQCDGGDLGGESCTSIGFGGGTLACDGTCAFDTSGCGSFPATGQTTAYGTGSDGDVQAGVGLSYTDNGDGTITDNNTGLIWEKKDDSGGIHDKDDTYTWSTGTNDMDGTITSTFLAVLNGDSSGCVGAGDPDPCCTGAGTGTCTPFAGQTDWRIPNYKELTSILDLEVFIPAVDPAFHQSATCTACADVTLATCSCTASFGYWSSTSDANFAGFAWGVGFSVGGVNGDGKSNFKCVRAVRGGS